VAPEEDARAEVVLGEREVVGIRVGHEAAVGPDAGAAGGGRRCRSRR
jgi:hypothetical protein